MIQEVSSTVQLCPSKSWFYHLPSGPRFRDVANTPLWLDSFDLLLCDLDGGSTSTEFARAFGEHKASRDGLTALTNRNAGLIVDIWWGHNGTYMTIMMYTYIFAMVASWDEAEALAPRKKKTCFCYVFNLCQRLQTLKCISGKHILPTFDTSGRCGDWVIRLMPKG